MLNTFEHFAVPALTPVAWNLVIIAALVGLVPVLPGGRRDLRVRDRHPGRDARPVPAAAAVAARARRPAHAGAGLARRARPAHPQADDAGDDHARADQLEPAHQLVRRLVRLQRGARGDRQGLPDLPAAAGDVLHRGGHGPVPDPVELASRGELDDVRSTMGNGVRQIFMFLIPCAVIMGVLAEPITRLVYQRGAFDAASHRARRHGAGLVGDLVAVPGREPDVLAHVLQPPAALGYHRARRPQPGGERRGGRGAVRALRDRRDRGRHRGRHDRDVLAQGWILRSELDGIEGARLLSAAVRMLAAAALLAAVCVLQPGRGSTTRSAGRWRGRRFGGRRDQRRPRWSTRPPSGRCAFPRRGRSGGCSRGRLRRGSASRDVASSSGARPGAPLIRRPLPGSRPGRRLDSRAWDDGAETAPGVDQSPRSGAPPGSRPRVVAAGRRSTAGRARPRRSTLHAARADPARGGHRGRSAPSLRQGRAVTTCCERTAGLARKSRDSTRPPAPRSRRRPTRTPARTRPCRRGPA